MATKKLADHTLYHLSPKGFWKKFRDAVVVNPEISSGLPIAGVNRYPPPGSRPERYSTPATKASDPAQNPYWKRLASLLLQHPENQALLTGPSPESSSVPALAEKPQGKDLAETIHFTCVHSEGVLEIEPPADASDTLQEMGTSGSGERAA